MLSARGIGSQLPSLPVRRPVLSNGDQQVLSLVMSGKADVDHLKVPGVGRNLTGKASFPDLTLIELQSRKTLQHPLLNQRGSSPSLTGARRRPCRLALRGADREGGTAAAAKGRVPLPEKSASPALSSVQTRSRQKRRGSSSPPAATWRRLALGPAPASLMVRRRSRQPKRVT